MLEVAAPAGSDTTLGYGLSLGAALTWAISVVLFKRSSDRLDALSLNVFKTTLGLVLLLITGLAFGFDGMAENPWEWMALAGSGALGIGLADTIMFKGLALIGASRQAIVDALYSPSVVLLSWWLLGETLTARSGLGGGLILAAVGLASFVPGADLPISRARLVRGTIYSGVAVFLMALAIVLVKPIVERHGLLWCTTVRVCGAIVAMGARSLLTRDTRQRVLAIFRPQWNYRYLVPAAVSGSYLQLLMWIGAFKYAPAGTAALLNQTSTVFIVLLAVLWLDEPMTGRLALAVALACAGSVVVLL